MDNNLLKEICAALNTGNRLALVTVIRTSGSTPQKAGSQMIVQMDGKTLGTIGGGCAEAAARLEALTALDENRPRTYKIELLNDVAAQEGMVCGGIMELFINVLPC